MPDLGFLHAPIVSVGSTRVDLLSILLFVAGFFVLARCVVRVLRRDILNRTALDPGTRDFVVRITRYAIILVGIFAGLQVLGINLGSLAVLAGVFSLGVGFGLQNVVSNFVSGIIVLFERPIVVGD